MFIIVNKDKIKSYAVSFSTVVILFAISYIIPEKNSQFIQTSVNTMQNGQENSEIIVEDGEIILD